MNHFRNVAIAGFMALAVVLSVFVPAASAADKRDQTWVDLKAEFFDDTAILDGSDFLTIKAPARADDAAIVPVEFSVEPGRKVKRVVLFVDENPVPMAADITFGPASPTASFSTRLRVNSYSYIRAVAQTQDGKLHMTKTYVKASGGCSAPANKDLAAAKASLGKMKLRLFPQSGTTSTVQSGARQAQIMIRHPNSSGFQMDQVTMLYIPAHFVDLIEVRQGDQLVMKVEGGISLSENPNLRFHYNDTGKGEITVKATDNEDGEFKRSWPTTGS
ncbi:MAG: quinoprotein dehydrogenase-associated SoxYZ-like carrier [Hyphomicrobiales bacterium]|nr:quinoprotein dehydrogenase-associated SoxYZ-like carrier [Hyphomicrobiales bacterium]